MHDSSLPMHVAHSSYREKLVEHLFVGELLRCLWQLKQVDVNVLKPEVDNSGYDIVLSRASCIRHIQLKCSLVGTRMATQNVHTSLALQPSGCVIWIVVDDELNLLRYLWFGGTTGTPLPDIESFRTARHTKGNAQGFKANRPALRKIPRGAFREIPDMMAIIDVLFSPLAERTA